MKSILLLLTILLSTTAGAEAAKSEWMLKSGKLTYHVHYPLKNVEGVSQNVKGKGACAADKCDFLIAVPLKSFESGDGNRDNHMLEVTKAGNHPMIVVKVSIPSKAIPTVSETSAQIDFAGESHTYTNIKMTRRTEGAVNVVTGTIPLVLSDFKVERPSLLAVKIDDAAPVDFELKWE